MSWALRSEDINVFYGESQILRDVSLNIPKGGITAVMGRNGVGKSTLLKSLMGVLPSRTGKLFIGETDVTKFPAEKRVHQGLGYVPQGRDIFPKLTVFENLVIGLEARTDKLRKVPEEEVYAMFPVLGQMKHRLGGNLSGGQQQQLAIARALVGDPSILILDEPTEGIQPNIVQEIEQVLVNLKKSGKMTIILVEQYFDFAREVADYFCLMERGRVSQQGFAGDFTDDEIQSYLTF